MRSLRRRAFEILASWVLVLPQVAQAQDAMRADRAAVDSIAAEENVLRQVWLDYDIAPDSITVGDPITLEVTVVAPRDFKVLFPERLRSQDNQMSVGDFELFPPDAAADTGERTVDDADAARDVARWRGRYTLRLYQVGEITLSPWPVLVRADSIEVTATTDSIRLYIESVLNDSLAAADMQDIKPQQEIPVPLSKWVYAGAAAVVIAALLAWWLWRRRQRRPTAVFVEPPRPAHEVALAELRKLESQRLPFEGRIKEHHVQLSEILRTYLEDARPFGIPALEQTTHEITEELEKRNYPNDIVAQVVSLCDEADLVKFAKHQPTAEECMQSLLRVRDFVQSTSTRAPVAPRVDLVEVAAGPTNAPTSPASPNLPGSPSSGGVA